MAPLTPATLTYDSFVEKYGAPYNIDLYLHRLGRTGRAGQDGRGLVVLLPFETRFKSKLRRRNVAEANGQFAGLIEPDPSIDAKVDALKQLVRSGHAVLTPSAENACTSFVAHYLEYAGGSGMSGLDVADAATDLACSIGLAGLPTLPDQLHATLLKSKK